MWRTHRLFAQILTITTLASLSILCNSSRAWAQAPGGGIVEQQLAVQHLPTKVVQNAIERLHAGNATTSINSTGTRASITLPGPSGAQTMVVVDHETKQVTLRGPERTVAAWRRLIETMDQTPQNQQQFTQLVPLSRANPQDVQQAIQYVQARGTTVASPGASEAIQLAQVPAGQPGPDTPPVPPGAGPPQELDPQLLSRMEEEGLLGPVQIEYLPDLGIIVLKGKRPDVERVMAIIQEIERLSVVTQPVVEVLDLEHVSSQAVADMITPIYDEIISQRQGPVSITPLVKPNSILLIGREDNVKIVTDLIRKLDQPAEPGKQFRVFKLKHMNATLAEQTITTFYEERGGLGTTVTIASDFRSNSLIVYASPRDLDEVAKLLTEVDVPSGEAVNQLRVFKLRNTLAEELAPVLEEVLRGRQNSLQGGQGGGGFGGGFGGGLQGGNNQSQMQRSTMLTLEAMNAADQQQLKSGVLDDVQISADARSNSLVVRAPEEAMPLIDTLIRQLDDMPSESALVKVFPILNGDAVLLVDVLQELFGSQQAAGGGQVGNQIGVGLAENPLVPVRFSVDERTNSIIAVGSMADLIVVESILLRLDEEDIRQRESIVYRLRYAPAADVANAINQFLQSERQLQDVAPNQISPFQQIEREVIVVPEVVSNSLIVSATPRYFKDITRIVEQLDARPPMVMIQVLIAEVTLGDFTELGIELGLQEPLLFDRSLLGDLIVPGFNFNNQPLGNANTPASLATRSNVGSQGLTSFDLGRTNDTQGYGGFVFSASSDSVSVLIRALEQDRRLQVLSRPQVMTMENQVAFVQVGQRVPRITSSQLTNFGTINNTTLENVGILLGVTPRISQDGIVVMQINAEKSELGPEETGIPISISANGDVIRSPVIDTTTAQTTVSARNGQTVVLGGLISESDSWVHRGVPVLSDIPIVGQLFRYDQQSFERKELLIIMTPYIVRGDQDVCAVNDMETSRMSWCLADVYRVHGQFDCLGYDNTCDPNAVPEIYPDQDPSAVNFMQGQSDPSKQNPNSARMGAQVQPVGHQEVVPVLPPKSVEGAAAKTITWQPNNYAGNPATVTTAPNAASTTTVPAAAANDSAKSSSSRLRLPLLKKKK